MCTLRVMCQHQQSLVFAAETRHDNNTTTEGKTSTDQTELLSVSYSGKMRFFVWEKGKKGFPSYVINERKWLLFRYVSQTIKTV